MAVDIVMPRMGLTMEQGTVVTWLKAEGEAIKAGEPLLEIETDKTTVEIEAPADGVLSRILARPGDSAPVGQVIGYLAATPDEAMVAPSRPQAAAEPAAEGKPKASPAARHLARQLGVDVGRVTGSGPGGRVVAWNVTAAAQAAATAQPGAAPAKVSPVAQRVAEELGVDLTQLAGSRPGGRITRQDVEQAARKPVPQPTPAAAPASAAAVQPLTRAHRIMAERMTASFTSAPHFYLHAEVDARRLVALREALLPRLEARAGVHLTLTDLLVKLCATTLADHPQVMAQWTPEGLRQAPHVNVGIAVDSPNGLVVPVIRDADQLGLSELARQRSDLVQRARNGKLLPQHLEEGVFTLTNLGTFRVDAFDAILNPPQAAILAMGRIKERALVEHGVIVPAAMLTLSLSVDHRVMDGAAAARFLSDLVELVELPSLALR